MLSSSNVEAERAVKTIKSLLKENDDPYIALMIYCSTPIHNGFSPSELLMNTQLHTTFLSQWQSSISIIYLLYYELLISEYSVVCEKVTMRKANIKKI